MDEKNETGSAAPEMPGKQPPLRRVGSFTLGACLIAAGAFFLCYHFVPGFDWQLALKIVPAAGLVMLGGEVLFFAARPGRWKYDFWSVLICLVLMAGCFCLSLLPVVWEEISPQRRQTELRLGQEYTAEAYDRIKTAAPEVRVKDIRGNAYLYSSKTETLRDLDAGGGHLSLTAGTLQRVEQYTLELDGIAQLDWTAEQMAKQTEIQYLLDEENEETAESKDASVESAELSE